MSSSRAVLCTLVHLLVHDLLVFGPPFTQDFSRSWEAVFQMTGLKVAESPTSAIRKSISWISSLPDQSHLGLLPVTGSVVVLFASSDWGGLLQVCILVLSKYIVFHTTSSWRLVNSTWNCFQILDQYCWLGDKLSLRCITLLCRSSLWRVDLCLMMNAGTALPVEYKVCKL